jgi:hypothetical protein
MFGAGVEEYILTLGVIVSFIGFLFFAARSRRDISQALKSSGYRRQDAAGGGRSGSPVPSP